MEAGVRVNKFHVFSVKFCIILARSAITLQSIPYRKEKNEDTPSSISTNTSLGTESSGSAEITQVAILSAVFTLLQRLLFLVWNLSPNI